jgi:hypothetical protein
MLKRIGWLGVLAALTVGVASTQVVAQVKQGKTRPLKTKQLMGAVVRPNCAALGEALKGSGPADDKAWAAAATNAALLNEQAHTLMADGRCPDAVWADACKQLEVSSQEVLTKIEAKDASGAMAAFSGVLKACGSCHSAHKK